MAACNRCSAETQLYDIGYPIMRRVLSRFTFETSRSWENVSVAEWCADWFAAPVKPARPSTTYEERRNRPHQPT